MSYSPEWLINYFGVVKAGGITIILNSMLKAPELSSLLRDSDSKLLITEKSFSQMLSSVLPTLALLKHVMEVDRANPYTFCSVQGRAGCYCEGNRQILPSKPG